MLEPIIVTVTAIHICLWLVLWVGFERSKRKSERFRHMNVDSGPSGDVSVIVAARNEISNLSALRQCLDQQSIQPYQILLIDDNSTDGTAEFFHDWSTQNPRLRVLSNPSTEQPRKKRALAFALSKTKTPFVALTDADCRPGEEWLSALVNYRAEDTVILGYSPFIAEPSFLNRIARLETFVAGFLGASAEGLGTPYTAVGRNIAYPVKLFNEVGGFGSSMHVLSGDDDLFVQNAAHRGAETVHAFGRDTYVPSVGPSSWTEWLRQKKRHTSASRSYRPHIKFWLGLFHVSSLAPWIAPLVLGVHGLILLALKLALEWLTIGRAAHVLNESSFTPLYPIWSFVYLLYNILVAPIGVVFGGPKDWRTNP